MEALYKNKVWLKRQYLKLTKSPYKIAQGQGCSQATVKNWLKKLGVKIRSRSEAQRISQSNHVDLCVELLEVLNGLMLGDGHLSLAKWSSFYQHGSKFRGLLVWLSDELNRYGIRQSGTIYIQRHKKYSVVSFHYVSRCYVELKLIHPKWYRPATEEERKKGKKYIKILPADLKLTPLTCLHWFIGDGYLGKCGKYTNYVSLCTQGFTEKEVYLLVSLLKSLGFKATKHKNKGIRICVKSTEDFFNYIGPCPNGIKGCLGYRWPLLEDFIVTGTKMSRAMTSKDFTIHELGSS